MNIEPLTSAVVKETVRRHWNGRATAFDEAPNHGIHSDAQRAAWLSRVRAWIDPKPRDVLDVGCGTGFLALLFASLGHRAVGVDAAEAMLEQARAKAARAGLAVRFQQADAEQLPFEGGSFDLVVERHVIWTLPNPAVALAEWMRVLRPGGRLVLIEGDWKSAGHEDYAPIREALPLYGGRPADALAEFVRSSGLTEVAIEPLMEATLWGEAPERERYALHVWKPR
jgi:ubiquinone/menaquinone biosynthesis C-methylase UbiE